MDPLRRLALDLKLRVKQARTERFKAADSKRKNLLDELEERERAFKRLVWTGRKRRQPCSKITKEFTKKKAKAITASAITDWYVSMRLVQ